MKAEIPQTVMARYDPNLKSAGDDQPGTIGLYGVIGKSLDGTGWTASKMAGVLRNIGARDVVLNINSPGGDVFEGLAMYNLLRDHPGEVTARIIGVAASAGSFVAMAADRIEIAKAASMMIHNTQSIAIGDRNAMRETADWMEQFDALLAEIYADRTGKPARAIAKLLDAETWLMGSAAVDQGFADAIAAVDVTSEQPAIGNKVRDAESKLRACGLSRSEAQSMIADVKAALSDSAPPVSLRDSADQSETKPAPSAIAEVLKNLKENQK